MFSPKMAFFTCVTTEASLIENPYRDAVVADGAVQYWRLNDAASTEAASEISAKDGDYENSSSGFQQGALNSDDSADSILITETAISGYNQAMWADTASNLRALINGTLECSFEFWCQPTLTQSPSSDDRRFFRAGTQGVAGSDMWTAWADGTTGLLNVNVEIDSYAEGTTTVVSPSTDLNTGGPYHIAISVDYTTSAGVVKAWINGVLEYHKTGRTAASEAAQDGIAIGYAVTSPTGIADENYAGKMSDFAIYDFALSDAQVAAHYAAGTRS